MFPRCATARRAPGATATCRLPRGNFTTRTVTCWCCTTFPARRKRSNCLRNGSACWSGTVAQTRRSMAADWNCRHTEARSCGEKNVLACLSLHHSGASRAVCGRNPESVWKGSKTDWGSTLRVAPRAKALHRASVTRTDIDDGKIPRARTHDFVAGRLRPGRPRIRHAGAAQRRCAELRTRPGRRHDFGADDCARRAARALPADGQRDPAQPGDGSAARTGHDAQAGCVAAWRSGDVALEADGRGLEPGVRNVVNRRRTRPHAFAPARPDG